MAIEEIHFKGKKIGKLHQSASGLWWGFHSYSEGDKSSNSREDVENAVLVMHKYFLEEIKDNYEEWKDQIE